MDSIKSLYTKDPDIRKWLICPRCESTSKHYLSNTDQFRCKRCGALFIADFIRKTTLFKKVFEV